MRVVNLLDSYQTNVLAVSYAHAHALEDVRILMYTYLSRERGP